MFLIFTASSDTHSAQHSSSLFVPLLHWLFPSMSAERLDAIHYLFRKCGHLTEYALLALFLWRAIYQPKRKDLRSWLWPEAGLSLALVLLYAASDELHQVFVPTRTAHFTDVLIDTAGGAIGLLLLWIIGKLVKRW